MTTEIARGDAQGAVSDGGKGCHQGLIPDLVLALPLKSAPAHPRDDVLVPVLPKNEHGHQRNNQRNRGRIDNGKGLVLRTITEGEGGTGGSHPQGGSQELMSSLTYIRCIRLP